MNRATISALMQRFITVVGTFLVIIGMLHLVLAFFPDLAPPSQELFSKTRTVMPSSVPVQAAPSVAVKTPSVAHVLPPGTYVAQSFNNCGPATLSIALSMFGKNVSQEQLASEMRPFNNPEGGVDDKSVFAEEFVTHAKKYGLEGIERPNGTDSLIKTLVANNIPVIVRTWLNGYEDIGHFRVIRGYDDAAQEYIVDDSYNGPNLRVGYAEFTSLWQPFNYGYILIYPVEKQELVAAIIGEDVDQEVAYGNALRRAEKQVNENPSDGYALFNLATSQYYLGNYQNSVEAYEKAEPLLPPRMLWYQYEPILSYQKLKNYDRVFQLTDRILYNGNLAYAELYKIRGEVYREQGNAKAAKIEFDKAVYYNRSLSDTLSEQS